MLRPEPIPEPLNDGLVIQLLQEMTRYGADGPSKSRRILIALALHGYSQEAWQRMLDQLLSDNERFHRGLISAQEHQAKLNEMLERLTAPPWFPAVFLGRAPSGEGEAALVYDGNARRVVTIPEDFDGEGLTLGDEVLLGAERNVLIDRSPYRFNRAGETATFERYLDDGRIIIRSRGEEMVVDVTDRLAAAEMTPGDLVRWSRDLWLAYERLERSRGDGLFLESTPAETFDDVGGLSAQIEHLRRSVELHLFHPEAVQRYGVKRRGSVLFVGPPGTGKTMLARAVANWLAELSGTGRCRFMNIKPAGLHSMWYGQTEANYREAFRVARAVAQEDPRVPVVMFFDEVDSVGAARGTSLARIDDRVLPSFMAELDGLEARGNVLVLASTNRADALDPALLRPGRLGDLVLDVPRPNREAARAIFAKHLRAGVPIAATDEGWGEPREVVIDAAVARIFAPNGTGTLATLTFRDGKQRAVAARELVSGAAIAKIAVDAAERACLREIETGEVGVRLDDLLAAIDSEFSRAVQMLTPANCHKHLSGLPQDVDVVRVQPVQPQALRQYRYLRVA